MTMSQPSAKLAPAPAATPLTAAITGTGIARMRSASGRYTRSIRLPMSFGSASGSGAIAGSDRSWPAQKPRPAPVTTTQRTPASSAAASSASRSCACISVVKAFSACGRFSVSVRTASVCEIRISSSAMEHSREPIGATLLTDRSINPSTGPTRTQDRTEAGKPAQ